MLRVRWIGRLRLIQAFACPSLSVPAGFRRNTMNPSRLLTQSAHTRQEDEALAVAELAEKLHASQASGVLLFCSSTYDLQKLGAAISRTFSAPVVGCTTAGQLGPHGLGSRGITGLALTSTALRMQPYLIPSLQDFEARAAEIGAEVVRTLASSAYGRGFGLLLVDGLSLAEERLGAALYRSIGSVPFIGGSAGDDMRLERTFVYAEGQFRTDAAVFALFETSLPFEIFKVQNVEPTTTKLVVTLADPDRRIVYELNGEPAAEAYAEAAKVPLEALCPVVFSKHPLLVTFHGEPYVRAIQRANADLSVTLQCAIEEGLVLTLGRSKHGVSAFERALLSARARLKDPCVTIGVECILRQLELDEPHVHSAVSELLARHRVFGFAGYGVQYNAAHLNQTFTGVILGGGGV